MALITIAEAIANPSISDKARIAIATYAIEHNVHFSVPILARTRENNDINGSAHQPFLVDFTYRDATEEDINAASTLGDYHYFGDYGTGYYTGHYYDGLDCEGGQIWGLVVDPPAYAVEARV